MNFLVCSLFALIIFLGSSVSNAATISPQVKNEVEYILRALKDSGCKFNRNGSWYTSAEAQAHLIKKLEYLERKNMINSAEDFITLGASTSSLSGKPYLVKCSSEHVLESNVWLLEQLQNARKIR